MSDMTLVAVIRRMNEGNTESWVDTNDQPVVPNVVRSTDLSRLGV